MGRWQPDARGRLARAAMTLFTEQGFEGTTAAEIALAAGLSESTFFRNFPDKREVLFYGLDWAAALISTTIAESMAPPIDAVGAALEAWTAKIQEDPDHARLRESVIAANPELQERSLAKHAELAAVMAHALRERGILEPTASLSAETGIAVFRVAYSRWLTEPGDLPSYFRSSLAELRGVLA